jgi:hypothetical protein
MRIPTIGLTVAIILGLAALLALPLVVAAGAFLLVTPARSVRTAQESPVATLCVVVTPTPLAAAPTATPISMPEPTTEPTDTPQPTPKSPSTPEPTTAPTSTPQPTPTSTNTPQPTQTPTITSQPTLQPTSIPGEPPHIRSFAARPDPIERGGTVTLTWEAPGTIRVGITRLSEEGDIFLVPEAIGLPASGSITVQVPDDYVERVKYYLGARDPSGVLHKAYVTVGIICRYDECITPRCPLTQDYVWAAHQFFEHGHMVWRSDTLEIYVLYADGTYETHQDTWHEGDPVDIPGTPPPGFHAPVRGFGNLYAQQPHVRERLGWATAPEAGYTMHVETIRGGSGRYPGRSIYFTLPDSRVVNLYPFTSTWEIIP